MSYNPFSIDNILADSVPKRCRTSPQQTKEENVYTPAKSSDSTHSDVVLHQTPSQDRLDFTSSLETSSASRTSSLPDTPASSKSSRSSPVTSTPCGGPRNTDEGSVSPCQLSPVPSSASEDSHEESKKKKARTSFSVYQIDALERKFASQRYLGASERSNLAESLNLSDHQVKTWFQNRRMKEKRLIKEAEERLGHPVTSLPAPITSVPSHLIMAPSHNFQTRYSAAEMSPSYVTLPAMHLGSPYAAIPQRPIPSVGHDLYQHSFPSSLAPQTSPIGHHALYHPAGPLRVQVGF